MATSELLQQGSLSFDEAPWGLVSVPSRIVEYSCHAGGLFGLRGPNTALSGQSIYFPGADREKTRAKT